MRRQQMMQELRAALDTPENDRRFSGSGGRYDGNYAVEEKVLIVLRGLSPAARRRLATELTIDDTVAVLKRELHIEGVRLIPA